MKINTISTLVISCALLGSLAPANANDFQIDEARFGGISLDIILGNKQPYYRYNLPGVNGEILFAPFDFEMDEGGSEGFMREVFTPRLHLGATVGLDDYSASSIYMGLTWHHALTETFFVETTFGGAVNNGEDEATRFSSGKWKRGLGSPALFRELITVGFNLTDTTNVLLQLSHMSHTGLAGDDNAGQTDLALKIGQKF